MELGELFNAELRTVGAWLPLGPAPERLHALHFLRERATQSPALVAEADALERSLESTAQLRVRFIPASPWPPDHGLPPASPWSPDRGLPPLCRRKSRASLQPRFAPQSRPAPFFFSPETRGSTPFRREGGMRQHRHASTMPPQRIPSPLAGGGGGPPPGEGDMTIANTAAALMSITGWRGLTCSGEPLEFNARNLRLAAESNPDFAALAARASANLPLLTAWRMEEAKKK